VPFVARGFNRRGSASLLVSANLSIFISRRGTAGIVTMTHPEPESIDRYAARQTIATEGAAIREHLLGCPACRERLRASPFYPEQGRRETAVIAGLEERAGCPEPAARVAWAVDALAPERRAEVEAHAHACAACRGDLSALQAIRSGAAPTEREGWLGRLLSVVNLAFDALKRR
jgi:hypothetical protein